MRLFRGADRWRDGRAHGLDELWSWVLMTWSILCVLVIMLREAAQMKLSDTYFFFMVVTVTQRSVLEELSFFIFWWAKDERFHDPSMNAEL